MRRRQIGDVVYNALKDVMNVPENDRFQIISERYERGAILMSTNRAFKNWPEIFNNDTTLTSALLDRLLHHADTCVVEGKSYRAKDHIPEA